MKTKPIPSIVMLAAGLIRCIYGILYRLEIKTFLWSLVLTMILFYFIGTLVKIVLDKNVILVEDKPDEESSDEETGEKELENIDEAAGEAEDTETESEAES